MNPALPRTLRLGGGGEGTDEVDEVPLLLFAQAAALAGHAAVAVDEDVEELAVGAFLLLGGGEVGRGKIIGYG